MKLMCVACKQAVDVPDVPPAIVQNFVACSVIVIEHAEQTMCPHCGVPVVPSVMAAQGIALVLVPAPVKQQPLIITPGRT